MSSCPKGSAICLKRNLNRHFRRNNYEADIEIFKAYRALTVFVIIAVSLDVAGGLLIPTITADIINYGVGGGNFEYIIRQGLLMALVSLLTGISALVGSSLSASLSRSWDGIYETPCMTDL